MTVRRKTFLAITITLAGLIVLLYVVMRGIMIDNFMSLDRQATWRNLERTRNVLQDNVDALSRSVGDWANWDETYQFALDGNTAYIESNLQDDTLWGLGVNLMVYLNNANETIYAKAVDLHAEWQDSAVENFDTYSRSHESFLRLVTSVPTSGLVVFAGEPMLIASQPILRSDETGPAAGTLIWGQHLGTEEVAALSRSLRINLDLFTSGAPSLPEDVLDAQTNLSPAVLRTSRLLNAQNIAGYTYLNDIYNQPTIILRAAQEQSAYLQGQPSLLIFLVALVGLGAAFSVVVLYLIDRLVLTRLALLSERVQYITLNDDFSAQLPAKGNDELAQLTGHINAMLRAVAQSRQSLQQLNSQLESRIAARTDEVERERSKLQAIVETMGEGLVYCTDGAITYANRAFLRLIDYPAEQLVGKPFSALTYATNPEETPVHIVLPQRYEMRLLRGDGSPVFVAVTSTPVESIDKHQHQVIIVRDITQEVEHKRQKDYFFARASHDLRSPLTSIMTRLYLLGKKPEQLETHLRILNHVSSQMLELVNDLLDVARLERGETVLNRRDLVVQTIVDQVVEVQRADAALKEIDLYAESVELPLHVFADPLRFTQLLTNLVSNAIHYTPEGGEIVVSVRLDQAADRSSAVIEVADTGIGIDQGHIEHIFDPFYRAHHDYDGGSGLGLHIVYEIVQLHGGEITVRSEIGKGTTFSVRLPLSSAEIEAVNEKVLKS